jgi:RTX calcium-binding nonapeptide repeat (4 copies)
VVRQGHLIVVVGTFLIGCAVLLVVGCAGVPSVAPQKEQGHTEATKEQGYSPEATVSEEARCEGTRTFKLSFHKAMEVQGYGFPGIYTTNDVPSCPSDGLLSGTEGPDKLNGLKGEDEIRGLGAADVIFGGVDSDVIYGGDGGDGFYSGDQGKDALYGGAGDDLLVATMDGQKDKLYCGEGRDPYDVDKRDYVSSSCEEKQKRSPIP